jgi:hypothetical protein
MNPCHPCLAPLPDRGLELGEAEDDSRGVLEHLLFGTDKETFINWLGWKNLLLRTCSTLLWEGERWGKRVTLWGGKGQPT